MTGKASLRKEAIGILKARLEKTTDVDVVAKTMRRMAIIESPQ